MPAKKILLVDDEPLVLRSMQKTLLRAGFDVETASNCTDGLNVFEAAEKAGAPIDLAVLDLNMPDFQGIEKPGAGLELLAKIKVGRPAMRAIVLTAYDEVNRAKEAISIGALDYCVKGREQTLLEQINQILAP